MHFEDLELLEVKPKCFLVVKVVNISMMFLVSDDVVVEVIFSLYSCLKIQCNNSGF